MSMPKAGSGAWPVLLAALIITAMSSGCVIPGWPPAGSGSGVTILDWKPDFDRVYGSETVSFYAHVQNLGSFEAKNVDFELSGLESWSGLAVTDLGCERGDINLAARNEQYGTSGEEMTCAWSATSPEINTGLQMVYSPKVTVCYDYLSRAVLRTSSISREELKRLRDSGHSIPSQSTVEGDSPVSISASTISPIIVTDSEVTFPVRISMNDAGGGILCLQGGQGICMQSDRMNKVAIELESTTASVVECPDTLTFFRRSGEVTCKMRMLTKTPTIVENEIGITATYRYCTEDTTSMLVQGQ